MVSLPDRGAVDVGEVRRDLASGQASGRQRQDDLVDPGQPALPFLHDRRLERAVPITGHLDLHRPDLGEHRLRPSAVAAVAAISTGGVVLFVAQVLGELRLERGLQHRLGQPGQQPCRADQLHTLGSGLRDQSLRELLLIHPVEVRHGLDDHGHHGPFPPSWARRVQRPRSVTPSS